MVALAICTTCGFDLRHCEESQNINLNALNFQNKADQILKQKIGFYNQSIITSQEWFEIARAWLSEIRFLVNTPNKNVIQLFESFDVNLHLSYPVTPLAFEYLNTSGANSFCFQYWIRLWIFHVTYWYSDQRNMK